MSTEEPEEQSNEDGTPPWLAVFQGKLPLESETAYYLLFSVLDVLFTYILLTRREDGGMRFYESNPVARFVINHWGVRGIVVFKFALVALVCFIAQLIATRRQNVAKYLMWFATAAVGSVVLYSAYLLMLSMVG